MSPDPVPSTSAPWRLPGAVSVLVAALCALLLLKWLAVAGLVALAIAALVGWIWRGGFRSLRFEQDLDDAVPAPRTAPRAEPSPDDCSWCGHPGGHRDAQGRLVRPRHAHAAP